MMTFEAKLSICTREAKENQNHETAGAASSMVPFGSTAFTGSA